jgi:hypothetical protein
MFGWEKKSKLDGLAEALEAERLSCKDQIVTKWSYFTKALVFKDEVTLAQKIEMFAVPAREYVEKNHQLLLAGPNAEELSWLTIFTAILESKTHSPNEVNAAIDQLSTKFAG